MPCTDVCADPLAAYAALAELGIDRVLTSGGEKTAMDGLPVITRMRASFQRSSDLGRLVTHMAAASELVACAKAGGPKVVVAGSVRGDNIKDLVQAVCTEGEVRGAVSGCPQLLISS